MLLNCDDLVVIGEQGSQQQSYTTRRIRIRNIFTRFEVSRIELYLPQYFNVRLSVRDAINIEKSLEFSTIGFAQCKVWKNPKKSK